MLSGQDIGNKEVRQFISFSVHQSFSSSVHQFSVNFCQFATPLHL